MPKFTITDKYATEEMKRDERVDNQEILWLGVTRSVARQGMRSRLVYG